MSNQAFNQEQAIKQYSDLMHIISVGAYSESSEDGSYWYGDTNISERIDRLEQQTALAGLKFVSDERKSISMEPMTVQEKAEYQAVQRAEREEIIRQLAHAY